MKRILLFGAYANGNIGDQFQAQSVLWHLRRSAPNVSVWAASASRAERAYEFDGGAGRLSGRAAIRDLEQVNSFDVLIVGGGGLLASPHTPLDDPEWVKLVRVPIVLLSLGADREVATKCRSVIERAAIVSVRDDFSLSAISALRPDARLLPDPILADPNIDGEPASNARGFCIIPRKQDYKNEELYRALGRNCGPEDRVVSMFPATDEESGVMQSFGNVASVSTMNDLLDNIRGSQMVLSGRYHGCIVALKQGIPCAGLASIPGSKISELYRQVGHEHLLATGRRETRGLEQFRRDLTERFDRAKLKTSLNEIQSTFRAGFSRILQDAGVI